MATGITHGEGAAERMGMPGEARPARLCTTLYDLITALQASVAPDEDALVVATVAHLLRSGRLTWCRPRPVGAVEAHGPGATWNN
jgi:hypothetical protein